MSTILWVEDFGGNAAWHERRVLIGQLLGENTSVPFELENGQTDKGFLRSNGILLVETVDDALTVIDAIEKFDFVILDVDLPKGNGNLRNPDSIALLQARESEFLKVTNQAGTTDDIIKGQLDDSMKRNAGFHLAMYLVLDKGFPHEHIIFFSAHADYYLKPQESAVQNESLNSSLQESFIRSRMGMKPFDIFEKKSGPVNVNSGLERKDHISEWLSQRQNVGFGFDYFVLRRGIIDECTSLAQDKYTSNLNFKLLSAGEVENSSLKVKGNSSMASQLIDCWNSFRDPYKVEFCDRLKDIASHLPIREPANKGIKTNLLTRLARTIVFDWDRYNPDHAKKDYAYVLHAARNFLSHGDLPVKEKDVAFLFILHVNSVFLNREIKDVRKGLLTLFTSVNWADESEKIEEEIKTSYKKMKDNYDATGKCKDPRCCQVRIPEEKPKFFLLLCQRYVLHCLHKPKDDTCLASRFCLLYQSFFHSYTKYPGGNIEDIDEVLAKAFAKSTGWIK